ncbi:THUMP domain-containing class I SAM-dependent RNA methyltransferase [Actibacterium ureilyticum]|uniref:THUMP domain-containing class I SAM-dependent RNA methyltransferase n=1 Tax=Actibacterium ureilyticum TaxID=1590614 RepID=UPI000BAAD453|nr:RNA methyltransferase [Actibacterium ureilyticum]
MSDPFDIFLVATPGLEAPLADEVRALGYDGVAQVPGGVTIRGGWPEIWRANLAVRGATRVLVRIAEFRALHLAQLDKRARKVPWADLLRTDVPVRVEATCRKSRIYHAGAAAQRITRAIGEGAGIPVADDAPITIKARIDDDLCTISLDTTGASLHKRGHKEAVNKAPMRETMAAMFLRACGFDGNESVLDPMCGSGTFVIEAAEIAANMLPGRSRHFAFEQLAGYDPEAVAALRQATPARAVDHGFYGSDRDAGAVKMSRANADRAGVADWTQFEQTAVADLTPPDGPPGLVIVNPPYGGRIGKKGPLYAVYGQFGEAMRSRFAGWRVGLITTDAGLAKSTGLPFDAPGTIVAHGGLKIRLWQTPPLT